MNMTRGFTVVEVLVTMAIMAILLTLGVVGLRSVQANARDQERRIDIDVIARGFEQFYKNGGNGQVAGSYPGYNELWNGPGYGGAYTWPAFAPGSSDSSFNTPSGTQGLQLICIFQSPSAFWSTTPGCEAPENTTTITSWVTPDKYGYEPITSDGGFCYNHDCVRFNLYWISEVDGQLKKVTSRRQ